MVSLDLHAPSSATLLAHNGVLDIFLGPETLDEASRGPLKGAVSAQKSPSRVRDGAKGVVGEERMKIVFPWRGVIDFVQKGNRQKLS